MTHRADDASPVLDPERAVRLLLIGVIAVVVAWLVVQLALPGVVPGWLEFLVEFAFLGGALAAIVPHMVFTVRRTTLTRSKPVDFVARDGEGFIAPHTATFGLFVAAEWLLLGMVGPKLVEFIPVDDGGADLLIMSQLLWVAGFVACCVLAVVVLAATVILFRSWPRLEIKPTGLHLGQGVGVRTIPWDALRSGTSPTVDENALRLDIERPELVVRRGLGGATAPIWLAYLRVDPQLLSDMIRFYVDHPDRRAAIGTQAEYERLLSDLRAIQVGAAS